MEIEMVSGLGTYLEIRPDKRVKNALLNPKRRRGNANVRLGFPARGARGAGGRARPLAAARQRRGRERDRK